MIAAWMLYCSVLGVLVWLAAEVAERVVLDRGGATRRVWAAGLGLCLALPGVGLLLRSGPPAIEGERGLEAVSPVAGAVMESVDVLSTLDGVLLAGWATASVALALLLLCGHGALALRARRWRPARVDGVGVLISRETGPAVVGLLRRRIVLPAWALEAAPAERSMMLRHEEEHIAAGDPFVLLYGALLVAAIPWNLAVWVMARKLRLAVEVDCDRRLTRGAMDTRRYAELLLAVGRRRSAPAYGVAFSLGRPFLEQRIDRMTMPLGQRRRAHACLLLAAASALVAAAWMLPQPVRAADVDSNAFWCPVDQVHLNRTLLQELGRST